MEVEIKNVSPSRLAPALGVAVLSVTTGILMYSYPTIAVSWDMLALLGVILVIFALLYGSLTFGATRRWRVPLLLWWILLVSEEVFSRFSTSEKALRNEFMFSAYSEAIIWLIVFSFIVIYTLGNRRYLRTMWSGSGRIVLSFAVVCLVSCLYAPQPGFAIAWAFKLVLAVLVIQACKDQLS